MAKKKTKKKPAAKKTSYINIGWEDIGRVKRSAAKARHHIRGLEDVFVKTVGKQGGEGGTFNERAAYEFAAYVKQKLLSGEAFQFGNLEGMNLSAVPLRDYPTVEIKRLLGLGYRSPEDIGYATGAMHNAIRPIDMGANTFRVGIPRTAKKSASDLTRTHVTKTGEQHTWTTGIEDIAVYAHWLEHGNPNNGRNGQPPRPWMGPTFWHWVEKELPKRVKNTIHNQFRARMKALAEELGEWRDPGYDPSSYITTSIDPELKIMREEGEEPDFESDFDTEASTFQTELSRAGESMSGEMAPSHKKRKVIPEKLVKNVRLEAGTWVAELKKTEEKVYYNAKRKAYMLYIDFLNDMYGDEGFVDF